MAQRAFGSKWIGAKRSSTPHLVPAPKKPAGAPNLIGPSLPGPAEQSAPEQPLTARTKTEKIPPFFIDSGKTDWPKQAADIYKIDPEVHFYFGGTNYRVVASSVENFRQLQRNCQYTATVFHTFLPKGSGQMKVVITGLPAYASEDDVF